MEQSTRVRSAVIVAIALLAISPLPAQDKRQAPSSVVEIRSYGIREATLADIVNYTTVVRPADADTLRAMRTLGH